MPKTNKRVIEKDYVAFFFVFLLNVKLRFFFFIFLVQEEGRAPKEETKFKNALFSLPSSAFSSSPEAKAKGETRMLQAKEGKQKKIEQSFLFLFLGI